MAAILRLDLNYSLQGTELDFNARSAISADATDVSVYSNTVSVSDTATLLLSEVDFTIGYGYFKNAGDTTITIGVMDAGTGSEGIDFMELESGDFSMIKLSGAELYVISDGSTGDSGKLFYKIFSKQ